MKVSDELRLLADQSDKGSVRERILRCADVVDELIKATQDMTYGLPDLLESIGYADEEGMVDKTVAALARARGEQS